MANTYTLLETITVGAAGASSVTFNSIPQTGYTDLKIVMSVRSANASNFDNPRISINGSTSTFTRREIYAESGSVGSESVADRIIGNCPAASVTASTFGSLEFYLPNYTSSNYKSWSSDSVTENNSATNSQWLLAGLWSTVTAVSTIAVSLQTGGNFAQYSTFSLYGISALGVTPTRAPKATGGSIIQTDGTYWYHAFLSSGTFTPATALSCDVLVVAGGGGGGKNRAGGGGAGGLRSTTSLSVSSATTVTIGGGGAGGASGIGSNGSDSIFSSITSTGGGGGGDGTTPNAASGGSGGGGGASGTGGASSPVTSPVQGFAGGTSTTANAANGAGGGGGGATAVGSGTSTAAGGNGGAGSSAFSSWGSITGTGQNVSGTYWYAGGGGGGVDNTNPTKVGGTGGNGGGANGSNGTATDAIANTGGGGGGGGGVFGVNPGYGSAGGSGLVIVRYLA
jgi:hypothetical protein